MSVFNNEKISNKFLDSNRKTSRIQEILDSNREKLISIGYQTVKEELLQIKDEMKINKHCIGIEELIKKFLRN